MDSCKQCFTGQYCTEWLRRSDIDKNIRGWTLFAYALVEIVMRWWWWKMNMNWEVIGYIHEIWYRTIIHRLHLKWCKNNSLLILCKMIISNGKSVYLHRYCTIDETHDTDETNKRMSVASTHKLQSPIQCWTKCNTSY